MTNWILNSMIGRSLSNMFPGFSGGLLRANNTKHDHYKDFGYPQTLSFSMLYEMYERNGLAAAAVEKTRRRTWQGKTFLLEQQRDGSQRKKNDSETQLEKEIRLHFKKIQFWRKLAEADKRALVGGYSGVLLRYNDGLNWDMPVSTVAGLSGLAGIEPVWASQLSVTEWYQDILTDGDLYGQPKMFEFQELPVSNDSDKQQISMRSFRVHPDRILIWSSDGTIFADSMLKAGYNDLIDLEKIKGAGGEGFWKNSKSAPVFEMEDAQTSFAEMAKAMGVSVDDLHDKMNAQVEKFNKGFDQMLMLQGMKASTLSVSLPSPEHFWAAPLQAFAASVLMPVKVLIGNQTGERASSEDAEEWDQTCMARREDFTHPLIHQLITKFELSRVLPEGKDWFIEQEDLTEARTSEKFDLAGKMSTINAQFSKNGSLVFTIDEIREVVDYEPIPPETLMLEPDPEDPQNKDNLK